MIVVDTSALLAIALQEVDREAFEVALAADPQRLMSAGTLAEVLIVSEGKGVGNIVRAMIAVLEPEIILVDEAMAQLAFEAFRRFGKGRHPARLNYGDCFAYALASSRNLPLLFKGNDFSQTDIESVL